MIQRILPVIRESLRLEHGLKAWISKRGIAASTPRCAKKMPDRPTPLNEEDFTESFLKGSGPGGQKIVSESQLGIPPPFRSPAMTDVR